MKKTTLDFINEMKIVNPNIMIMGEYINSKTKIKCKCKFDNTEWMVRPNNLLNGSGCPMCGKKKQINKSTKTNEEFLKQLNNINPNIEILSMYKGNRKHVLCRCKIDHYQWENTPMHLLYGQGCPLCSNRAIKIGTNDLWTTNPEIAKLLVNPKDGYKYTYGSGKSLSWKCPNCGEIINNIKIKDVYNQGLSCPKCSDGVSYPNKFMYNLLKHLNIQFINEYKPNWCKFKIDGTNKYGVYDFYLPSYNILIEMDGGLGHGHKTRGKNTPKESKLIDDIKDKLASQNNIEVIRIDCNYISYNKFDYVKNNIVKSELSTILDFTYIDWKQIDIDSLSSFIIESVKLWNQGYCMKQIANIIHKHPAVVSRYIRKANKVGLCEYIPHKYSGKNIIYE